MLPLIALATLVSVPRDHFTGDQPSIRAGLDAFLAARGVHLDGGQVVWPSGEPVEQPAGRHVIALHGDRDRVTSPADTADCVRRARRTAARAGLAVIGGGDHAMLRRHRLWHRTAATAVAHLLAPEGTPDPLPGGCYGAGDFPVL